MSGRREAGVLTVDPPAPPATGQFYVRDLPNLDLMRALAVLLVLVAHALETIGKRYATNPDRWDLPLGRMGVLMFFVHTSLVLMLSLQRSPFGGASLFTSFYIRRLFRIYPLSILTVILVVSWGVPQAAWQTAPLPWRGGTVAANLLLLQNVMREQSVLGPLWSLPYEIQMYLVLPVIFLAIVRFGGVKAVAAAWIVALALGLVQARFGDRLVLLDVARYGPCFIPGVAAFVIAPRVQPRWPWYLWPLLLAATIVAFCGMAYWLQRVELPWMGWICCGVIGLALPRFRQVPVRWIRSASHVVAKYSFGIYLSHLIALWFAFTWLPPLPVAVQLVVASAVVVAASWLAYHTVEQPMIEVGARIANAAAASRLVTGFERKRWRPSV